MRMLLRTNSLKMKICLLFWCCQVFIAFESFFKLTWSNTVYDEEKPWVTTEKRPCHTLIPCNYTICRNSKQVYDSDQKHELVTWMLDELLPSHNDQKRDVDNLKNSLLSIKFYLADNPKGKINTPNDLIRVSFSYPFLLGPCRTVFYIQVFEFLAFEEEPPEVHVFRSVLSTVLW